jgi:hypothetical protein
VWLHRIGSDRAVGGSSPACPTAGSILVACLHGFNLYRILMLLQYFCVYGSTVATLAGTSMNDYSIFRGCLVAPAIV